MSDEDGSGSANAADNLQKVQLITSFASSDMYLPANTDRIEMILKVNKIPYEIVDLASNDKAKRLVKWTGKDKKLPLVVRDNEIVGVSIMARSRLLVAWFQVWACDLLTEKDFDEIVDANEFDEVKQVIYED